ncbi:uncharacterized protein LOC135835589 [Planococcus citri]|uniref:uncharacterized protein LOC135835589 n=1 Tax=Planococcus citri TaxID=170843 RepID=UPI0031F798CB
MKKSITIVVVCVAFFVQVNQSSAKVQTIDEVFKDPLYEPLSKNARSLVATMLDHVQYMLRNKYAADALVTVATNTEKVLTSQSGQDNILAILDLIGFLLKDPKASKIIAIWCDKADKLVTSEEGRAFLRAMIQSFHRVLSTSNVLGAATAMMEGIEYALTTLSPHEIKRGMSVMQSYIVKSSGNLSVPETDLVSREIHGYTNDFEPGSFAQNFQPQSPRA